MPTSRVNKFEKRRKNTKLLSILIVVASILIIVLLGMLIFGGDDEADKTDDNQTEQTADGSSQGDEADSDSTPEEQDDSAENNTDTEANDSNNGTGSEDESDSEEENSEEVTTEQVEPSDDNVIEAYTGDWQPVGTEQSEPHTINYNDGSQDRQEMRKAVASATGLDEANFTMWWIERNGDQKVINTVSNADESEIYRVYNTWVPNEGWQPTKVERLKENDQKERFE
ncbi:Protein of unknown function [Lentibacillus halodurans]|uniref:DUF1510 domain-containing protein n=1 Tax=Lentibacillus halodurans TaxID=237679 RepID=A0A1I0V0P9_9BACI|nr:YrrS family protein [Lentibacillus halodurans]SFA69607.1 Protein of unknown function [Lentibacillus halodurans]